MKSSNAFKDTIKNYLDKRASEDELFSVTYKKENKTLDECCSYVMKCAKEGGAQGYTDDEVFDWAIHYYDEDDIKNIKPFSGKVIVNHTVELTAEEIEKAKENAIEIATKEFVKDVKKDLKVNVQLTEEEITEAKKIAVEEIVKETKQKMSEKKKPKSIPVPDGNKSEELQPSLF